jgi:hypothetical protein
VVISYELVRRYRQSYEQRQVARALEADRPAVAETEEVHP